MSHTVSPSTLRRNTTTTGGQRNAAASPEEQFANRTNINSWRNMFAEDNEKLIVNADKLSSDEILNSKLRGGVGDAAAVSDYLDISPFLKKPTKSNI